MAIALDNDHGADERAALKAAMAVATTKVLPELLGSADFSDQEPWNELTTNFEAATPLDPRALADAPNPGEVETPEQRQKRVRFRVQA